MEKKLNEENNHLKPGDVVIGQADPLSPVYSNTGAKLVENGVRFYADEKDIANRRNILLKMTENQGGKLLADSNKKSIKKIASKRGAAQKTLESYQEYAAKNMEKDVVHEEVSRVLETVQFENQFGKIKAKVEKVIEEELAFMLVFSNEDMVVFEPKIGETLNLYTPEKQKFAVYYPGVTFSYPPDKRLMVLFKLPVETDD
jgi:hypothetical protein